MNAVTTGACDDPDDRHKQHTGGDNMNRARIAGTAVVLGVVGAVHGGTPAKAAGPQPFQATLHETITDVNTAGFPIVHVTLTGEGDTTVLGHVTETVAATFDFSSQLAGAPCAPVSDTRTIVAPAGTIVLSETGLTCHPGGTTLPQTFALDRLNETWVVTSGGTGTGTAMVRGERSSPIIASLSGALSLDAS